MTPEIAALAKWSAPCPLSEAVSTAPLSPGVYLIYTRPVSQGAPDVDAELVYIGMAGERRGRGVRDRLRKYVSGKAGLSGFGEAALDRAVADPDWMHARWREAVEGRALRTKELAALAIVRLDPTVRWTSVGTRGEALELERAVGAVCAHLWNRRV